MRPSLCGFRHRPRPSENQPPPSNCGLAESVKKFLKPRSLWAAIKAKPKQFSGPENQVVPVYQKGPTLEDLIRASPAGFSRSSEYKPSSRRIHPSLFDGGIKAEVLPEYGETERKQAEVEKTGICRTKSGKEKKVTFRSPEVAEVFVVEYLPEICVIDKGMELVGVE